jgi:hypothetical protein
MMLSRLFLVVLTFFATESVWAICPVPLQPGQMCCTYTSRVDGQMDNRFTRSFNDCKTDARLIHNQLAFTAGCDLLLGVQENSGAVIAPTPPSNVWRRDFSHSYDMWTGNPFDPSPNPILVRADCATFHGYLTWVPPPACVITRDLPAIPEPVDACTAQLEANRGLPVPGSTACPAAPVMDRPGGEPCWRRKVNESGALYAAPTSTIRTVAYNTHLKQVWDFYKEHQKLRNNPTQWQACAARRAVVETEMT